ncbi:hypothetical protein VOLCADRAFT_95988, partial [Volvox carteri f. nagariensis]
MPRIRKLQYGGASRKLGDCFTVLLSGVSGECLAGEMGCCGDSCCSSAVVSRALAEYCQHSDAAREAFVAAKGLDALQMALTRGSPSVATAAARVLGALCSTSHGLRCVLRWQSRGISSGGGGDLLSRVAAISGQVELPPDLRAECVDVLRCVLGSIHGPAAGSGMDLAGVLQTPLNSSAVETPGISGCGIALATDSFIVHVALPPLLSDNAHLRAAAARLVAAAAEEGLLAGGAAAAAASLSAALHLVQTSGSRDDRRAEVHTSLSGVATCGGGGGGGDRGSEGAGRSGTESNAGPNPVPQDWRPVLALCELVAALLGSSEGAELLVALRAPAHVLALCREVLTGTAGGAGDGCQRLNGSSAGDLAGTREALLDAVLLCARDGQYNLWTGKDETHQRERRVFVAGAAKLAALLLRPSLAGSSSSDTKATPGADTDAVAQGSCGAARGSLLGLRDAALPPAYTLTSTAAALASALASWPAEVLQHRELAEPLHGLLCSLSDAVRILLGSGHHGGVDRRVDADNAAASVMWQLPCSGQAVGSCPDWDPGWPEVPPHRNMSSWGLGNGGGCKGGFIWHSGSSGNTLVQASTRLRVASAAAAAAVRLYGAVCGGEETLHEIARSSVTSVAGKEELQDIRSHLKANEESAVTAVVAQCLSRVLEASHDGNAAVTMLTPSLEALLELPTVLLKCLAAARTATTSDGCVNRVSSGFSLVGLGLAAARLAEHILQVSDGNTTADSLDTPSLDCSSTWYCGGSKPAITNHARQNRPATHVGRCSSEQHVALLTALRVWSRAMELNPDCTCRLQEGSFEEGSEHAAATCDACNVRPIGFLSKFVGAME